MSLRHGENIDAGVLGYCVPDRLRQLNTLCDGQGLYILEQIRLHTFILAAATPRAPNVVDEWRGEALGDGTAHHEG